MRREQLVGTDDGDGNYRRAGLQSDQADAKLWILESTVETSGALGKQTDYLSLAQQFDGTFERLSICGPASYRE